MRAVDDAFEIREDTALVANVTYNDVNATPLTTYYVSIAQGPSYIQPGKTTPVVLSGLGMDTFGIIDRLEPSFRQLWAGTVITFTYFISIRVAGPGAATAWRSNNATVTITVLPGG